MATDENVVQFPKEHKGHKHDPEAEQKMYVVKIKVPNGEYRMGIMACSVSCVFATIIHAIPEDETVQAVVIMNTETVQDLVES